MVNCSPYAARNEDWSIGGTLILLEQYNGPEKSLIGRAGEETLG